MLFIHALKVGEGEAPLQPERLHGPGDPICQPSDFAQDANGTQLKQSTKPQLGLDQSTRRLSGFMQPSRAGPRRGAALKRRSKAKNKEKKDFVISEVAKRKVTKGKLVSQQHDQQDHHLGHHVENTPGQTELPD